MNCFVVFPFRSFKNSGYYYILLNSFVFTGVFFAVVPSGWVMVICLLEHDILGIQQVQETLFYKKINTPRGWCKQ